MEHGAWDPNGPLGNLHNVVQRKSSERAGVMSAVYWLTNSFMVVEYYWMLSIALITGLSLFPRLSMPFEISSGSRL